MTVIKLAELEKQDDALIEQCERLLELAKSGEVVSVLIAMVHKDGCTSHAFSQTHCSSVMVGAVEAAKYHFMKRWIED